MSAGHRSRARLAGRSIALTGVLSAMAACGGGATTVTLTVGPSATTTDTGSAGTTTATATSSGASSASSSTSTATGPAGPAITLVWAVTNSSGGTALRTATPGGGAATSVATLPAGAFLMGFGHGKAVAQTADHHILTISIPGGAQVTHPGGSGNLFGGAFDDSGQHIVFVDAIDPSTTRLKVLDLSSDQVSTVATLTNQFVAPVVWTGSTIAGPVVVGFSGAPQQGARRVNATTGAQLAQTTVPGGGGYDVFADASHGAATAHSSLGDDADAVPGPGPLGPFNTLVTFTIGGATNTVLSEAHHNIAVLHATPDGGTILIDDSSAAGGFAGISMSAEFGLFLVRGSGRVQLAHIGAQRVGGTILQDGGSAVVAEKTDTAMTLVQYPASGPPITLDTVAGGQQAMVALVPAA